jgi:hypothetical protein
MLPAAIARIEWVAPGDGRIGATQGQRAQDERSCPVSVTNGDPQSARGNDRRETQAASLQRAQRHRRLPRGYGSVHNVLTNPAMQMCYRRPEGRLADGLTP